MPRQQKKKRPSSSSREEEGERQQQDLLLLHDKESSNGIRSEAGQPVLCIHHGVAVLTDEDVINRLIDLICGEFVAAFNLLPVEEHPELIGRLNASGHCLGLLEPRTNIIVNVILHSGHQMDLQRSGSTTAWRMTDSVRRSCLQKQYWMAPANQSLNGLVVFLMSYFRYLSKRQALRYLFLAHCDLMLAIGLVECDLLNRAQFTFHDSAGMSIRAVDSLYLATVAAKHSYADKVSTFVALRFRQYNAERFCSIMKAGEPITAECMKQIITLLKPQREEPHVTASSLRHVNFSAALARILLPDALIHMRKLKEKVSCDYSATVEGMLLDALYACYMKAFDCLGMPLFHDLQTSILRSGLCFGPFDDPVENILLNAIWFKTAYPQLSLKLEHDLVHSERISLLCRVSLNINISFLCRKYMTLSSHDAILLLYQACFNRSDLDRLATRTGHSIETDDNIDNIATLHALRATGLPQCDNHMAIYLSTISTRAKARIKKFLCGDHHKRNLNIHDVNSICEVLMEEIECPLHLPPLTVRELSNTAASIFSQKKRDFKHKERRIKRKLNRMISTYYMESDSDLQAVDRQTKNEWVKILCIFGGQRFYSNGKPFFHVNVLARDTLSTKPEYNFFFAQLWESRQYEADFDFVVDLRLTFRSKGMPLSSQLSVWSKAITAGRCLSCETAVTKIIHPMDYKYVGKSDKTFADCLGDVYGACEGDRDSVIESECVYFDNRYTGFVEQLEGLHDELETFLPSD